MNMKRIKQLTVIGIATLAVCALMVPALGSQKKLPTRPIKVKGNMTVVVNPLTGFCTITDWGEGTHVGRYWNTGSGYLSPEPAFVAGSGTVIAADDRSSIDWMIGAPNTVVYTGGKGRFQGITGGFVATPTSESAPVDNGDGTVTIVFTYIGIGEATY